MAIGIIEVPGAKNRGLTFRQHDLAHELLGKLHGLEIGAGSQNPFGLPRSINVAPQSDFEHYKAEQIEMCGRYAQVDVFADASALPFEDNSQDYVISSHVVEHLPDVVAAIKEWARVIRDGGYIFMIYPQRDAHPGDRSLPTSTPLEIAEAHERRETRDTWDYYARPVPDRVGGHYWRFTPEVWETLIGMLNAEGDVKLDVVATENPDKKVGNGHTLVLRVVKPAPVTREG